MTSWIIRNKATREVICETFELRVAKSINTEKYEAVPIYEYLAEVNRRIRAEVAQQINPTSN